MFIIVLFLIFSVFAVNVFQDLTPVVCYVLRNTEYAYCITHLGVPVCAPLRFNYDLRHVSSQTIPCYNERVL